MKRIFHPLILTILLALATLLSEAKLVPGAVGLVCGPAIMLSLLVWAVRRGKPGSTDRQLVVIALLLSGVADIVMSRQFIYGLGVFLLVHVVYIVLFGLRGGWSRRLILPVVIYGAVAVIIMQQAWPVVSADTILQFAVPIYVTAVTLMASLAASVWRRYRTQTSILAAIGGISFFISDSFIALNEFIHREPLAGLWILPTYWLAQCLIVASLSRRK